MKKTSKVLLTLLCVVLLVVGSAMGTLAYLADTDSDTNTFTVGKVDIKLDEAVVDEDGKAVEPEQRTEDGNKYELVPGRTVDKDPTVTVLKGSEESYVRMIVTVKNYDKLVAAFPADKKNAKGEDVYSGWYVDDVLLIQNLVDWNETQWPCESAVVSKEDNTATYEFRYYKTVDAREAEQKLEALFKSITVPGSVSNTELDNLKDVEIVVVANAIQKEGFSTDDAAWTAWNDYTVEPYVAPTEAETPSETQEIVAP